MELPRSLEKLRADTRKSQEMAGVAMKVSDVATDQQALEVINRHRAELEAAFAGR
jgi:hypothetical protein